MLGRPETFVWRGRVGPEVDSGRWLSEMWLRLGYAWEGRERDGIDGEGAMDSGGSNAAEPSTAE